LRHIGEWSGAARTIDESGYKSDIACAAGSQIRDCHSFPFSCSWQATKRHRCSAASSALSNERIFDIRSACCLPMPPMTLNGETRMTEDEHKARALP